MSVRSARQFVLSQVVTGLRRSKSLILRAPRGRKKICDYSLQRDWLRKYKLHGGSRSNQMLAAVTPTRPHLRGMRSPALRSHAVSLYRNITSVRRNRRKRNTKWREAARLGVELARDAENEKVA